MSSLTQYLQDMTVYMLDAEEKHDGDCVRLMTIHQSKGLEFPVVFIAGLTEGTFPSHRTIRERRQQGEEEERRLMYVAVTRAKDRLYMLESEGFLNDGATLKFPSRFLYEIPEGKVRREGINSDSLRSGMLAMVEGLNRDVYGIEGPKFQVGDRVRHRLFGDGTVIARDADSDSYTVRFADCERTLLPRVLSPV